MDLTSGLGSSVLHCDPAATFLRAASSADTHGDRRSRGLSAPCVRGRYKGFISPFLCLGDYRNGSLECSRDGGCSVGRVLLAKFDKGELPTPRVPLLRESIVPMEVPKEQTVAVKKTVQKKKDKRHRKRPDGKFKQAIPFIRQAVPLIHGVATVHAVLKLAAKLGGPTFSTNYQRKAIELAGYNTWDNNGILCIARRKKKTAA